MCATQDSLYWANIPDAKELQKISLSELKISVDVPVLRSVSDSTVALLTSSGQQEVLTVSPSGLQSAALASGGASLVATTFNSRPILFKVESAAEVKIDSSVLYPKLMKYCRLITYF